MKNKLIDFPGILKVLKEEVAYVKGISVTREDFEGVEKEYKVTDISISSIFIECLDNIFHNGFLEEEACYSVISNSLVTIWINNERKTYRGFFANSDLPLNPENVRIFFRANIHDYILKTFDDYATSKVKDNKLYVAVDPAGHVYVEKTKRINNFSQDILERVRIFSRDIYRIDRVIASTQEAKVIKKTKVIVDSFGTEIIEANDHVLLQTSVQFFTAKKEIINPTNSRLYKTGRQLMKNVDNFEREFRQNIDNVRDTIEIESGIIPILLDPYAVHTFMHEALGAHMFSASYIANQESRIFENKIGADIAYNSDLEPLRSMSIFCNPNEKGFVASYKYDNEGSKSMDVCLLEKGIVRNYLTCLNSAKRLNLPVGGHSLVESYIAIHPSGRIIPRLAEPRVSNLIVKSHVNKNVDQVRRDIESFCLEEEIPFYLEASSRAGEVDVATGNFKLNLDNIHAVYPDGTRKNVLEGTLTGDLFGFVSAIAGISNTYGQVTGHCGAGSGWVPTHGKAPYMFLYGINFAPSKPPEKSEDYSIERDKYIPE